VGWHESAAAAAAGAAETRAPGALLTLRERRKDVALTRVEEAHHGHLERTKGGQLCLGRELLKVAGFWDGSAAALVSGGGGSGGGGGGGSESDQSEQRPAGGGPSHPVLRRVCGTDARRLIGRKPAALHAGFLPASAQGSPELLDKFPFPELNSFHIFL